MWLKETIPQDDYVTGERFAAMADAGYRPGHKIDIRDRAGPVAALVYCETHDLRRLLDELVAEDPDTAYVIIAHNSDAIIHDGEHVKHGPLYGYTDPSFRWADIPANVLRVYAQNVDARDERLIPIPIGFENSRYFPADRKHYKIFDTASVYKGVAAKSRFCYMRHALWTNASARLGAWAALADHHWMTFEPGSNGYDFDRYLYNMAGHKLMICPDGNGIDTVRLWECLLVRTVPVVQRHVFTEYFAKEMPIVVVDDYADLTEAILMDGWRGFVDNADNYTLRKARLSYWAKEIARDIGAKDSSGMLDRLSKR